MTSNELLYVKGAQIWIPHPETVWESCSLLKDYKKGDTVLHLQKTSGEKYDLSIKSENDLPHLRNPSILIGQSDLTALSYLHEPGVLHNLEVRFRDRQAIYTYCGIVLVAINPYAELPLYGADIIRAYRGHSMGELEPHIFAVAEEAYAKLEREKCDLSIIVSGESGAGKTVSAKYAMRYFAAVGGSESETQIERKVLASSPIMEAIGNAKTTRNDNSSRFGKFTKLLFTNDMGQMTLTGATMQTYLLEKSRVVFQSPGERNYHIFYQLCAARQQWPELVLDHQDKFRYLKLGGSPDIDRVSDLDQFSETVGALTTLGFSTHEIRDIMKILAGILHLGNINFRDIKKKDSEEIEEGCDISQNDIPLLLMAEILKLDVDELRKWLIMRQIESVNENVLIPNSKLIAETARDALAKHIYARLFQYIVEITNKSLVSGRKQNCFIGVLDIYGFETFDTNSFEQFCINYANEKLQQQFNQHVFKLEQEEYLKEGIVWTMIDFYDNQPCIDLIEAKLGVLDLLDEECRMPKGSDESWAGKLYEKCAKYKHFDKPRFGVSSFLVKHFSDLVEYDVNGFLEKNRDTVSKELVNVVRQSEMGLCRRLMEMDDEVTDKASSTSLGGRVVVSASKTQLTPSKQHRKTVGSQFRDSLSLLIQTLHATTPHYVRCIKPNEDKSAFKWDAPKIVQQLRACGVLETVRISAAGFPSRWGYMEFYSRYRLLCKNKEIVINDIKKTCQTIVKKWLVDEDKYRFGNTQIFFRAGQVAYLEQVRSDIRKKYIIIVQSVVRRFIYRRLFLRLQRTALGIQTYSRGLLARRKAKYLRENRAAIIIQKYVRGWLCRTRYLKLRYSICGIQQYARGMLARLRFRIAMDNYKATQVQRYIRGYLVRREYRKKIAHIIKCQAVVRGFLARRLYKRMKAEARTISHMQKMYKGLENKIISLQQKIDELNRENNLLKSKTLEIGDLKAKLDAKKNIENELKSLKSVLLEKDASLMSVTKQLELERDEKMMLLEEKDREEQEWNTQRQTWRVENEELKRQFDEMIELAKKEESLTMHRTRIMSEVDTNDLNQAYQRAVKDKEVLENENYLLKEELARLQRTSANPSDYNGHSRSLSNASSQNEEDFGYSSAKNTLELKRGSALPTENSENSTPKRSQTSLIIKLRKILEEEKTKNELLEKQYIRIRNKSNIYTATEDSLRISELEVENDKLKHDYELLRNSIHRGVEQQELYAQNLALQEEVRRRREECIQLRAVLAQHSQLLKPLNAKDSDHLNNNGELVEAFQALKLVNKQLESELTALTEEHNARVGELVKQNDDVRNELNQLRLLKVEKLETSGVEADIETLRHNDMYLRYELEKAYSDYVELQEQLNGKKKQLAELTKRNSILIGRLHEHGISDAITEKTDQKNLPAVKKKVQQYQGIFKYRIEDEGKILQRLITDLTPRVAIGLLPGLPAYIILMCIRYTDLVNTDEHVRTLLTNFVVMVKKIYRLPTTTECRVLWLVNTITLHNLLKQYGGIDEYIKLNTETQNQQQLKNFDLSEYRQVIYETIINSYRNLVNRVQELIKPYIVPAILDHDEMSRGRSTATTGRSMSLDISPEHHHHHNQRPEPKSLANQLEHFYKQFQYFGLDNCYIEQIFKQLMFFIMSVSLNSLMFRPELCMWKTGMKIRYNVSCLEDWARKKKMSGEVLSPIQSLIQVSSLLQSRKTEEDVHSIYELCSELPTAQVLKIIKSYHPDDCENPISNEFIEKLTEKLNERTNVSQSDKFTMDENEVYPLKVVFKHSDIKLEDIELPPALNLDGLLTKI